MAPLTGTAEDDTLIGGPGDDYINGGAGADFMSGGPGWDTYVVDNENDRVEEAPGLSGGHDWVQTSVSFTLSDYVEGLHILGSLGLNGSGNAIDNILRGNDGADTLRGLDGDDQLMGGKGADTLYGGNGNDSLHGELGADQIYGGKGNDTYFGVTAQDGLFETSRGGIDTIQVQTSWTLGAHFENLTLGGYAQKLNGTGNGLDNSIGGNQGNNRLVGLGGDDILRGWGGNDTLDGGTGIDTMDGGAGNDIYSVDNAADEVIEIYAGSLGGFDVVNSTVTFTLDSNFEALRLSGGAIDGTGNDLDNEVSGTSLTNMLRGMAGADSLQGGGGADTLVGGRGADLLVGGTDKDIFVFSDLSDSPHGDRDRIQAGNGAVAFEKPGDDLGDRFDFHLLDADTTQAGVQAFEFGLATDTGCLWATSAGDSTLIRGNVDADGAAEIWIVIDDGSVLSSAYTAADFIV